VLRLIPPPSLAFQFSCRFAFFFSPPGIGRTLVSLLGAIFFSMDPPMWLGPSFCFSLVFFLPEHGVFTRLFFSPLLLTSHLPLAIVGPL